MQTITQTCWSFVRTNCITFRTEKKTLEMQNCVRGIIYLVMSRRFHYFCANFTTCRRPNTQRNWNVRSLFSRDSRRFTWIEGVDTHVWTTFAQAMNEMWIFVCKSCIRIARDRQRDRLKFFPFNGQVVFYNKP